MFREDERMSEVGSRKGALNDRMWISSVELPSRSGASSKQVCFERCEPVQQTGLCDHFGRLAAHRFNELTEAAEQIGPGAAAMIARATSLSERHFRPSRRMILSRPTSTTCALPPLLQQGRPNPSGRPFCFESLGSLPGGLEPTRMQASGVAWQPPSPRSRQP